MSGRGGGKEEEGRVIKMGKFGMWCDNGCDEIHCFWLCVAFLWNLCIHIRVNLVNFHLFSESLVSFQIIGWFLVTTLLPEGRLLLHLFGRLGSDFWQRYLIK